jgi:uncharacterized glyoxalase superfamily protein PhnB
VTAAEVRERLIEALRLDLIGPEPGGEHAGEVLPMPPSRWYLTGFLVPYEGGEAQRSDFAGQDELDQAGADDASGDDGAPPEPASARKAFLPSSMGVSVLVPGTAESLQVDVDWSDYTRVGGDDVDDDDATVGSGIEGEGSGRARTWQREPRHASVPVPLPAETERPVAVPVPGSGGLELAVAVRPVRQHEATGVPAGTRSVAVFLVNRREPAPDGVRDRAFAFQATLTLRADTGFVARPDPRGGSADEWDEQVADLQYRDVCEFAVGHGVSTRALTAGGHCSEVATTWLPQADVERVEPARIEGVELSMEALADARDPAALRSMLTPLVTQYGAWIGKQKESLLTAGRRADVGAEMLKRAATAKQRIAAGIDSLEDADVFTAFRLSKSIFGGEFMGGIMRFRDFPPMAGMADMPPLKEEEKDLVGHVALPVTEHATLMGTDITSNMPEQLVVGNNIQITLEAVSAAEAESLFGSLSEGGRVVMPLSEMFWAEKYGACVDRFGIHWQINYTGERAMGS